MCMCVFCVCAYASCESKIFGFILSYETIDSDPTVLGNRIGHLFLTP